MENEKLKMAKDAVAKEKGCNNWKDYLYPDDAIYEDVLDKLAIKYNELMNECIENKVDLQSIIFTRSGSIYHSFADINDYLNDSLKGANIEIKNVFTNYDSHSQVATLTMFYLPTAPNK